MLSIWNLFYNFATYQIGNKKINMEITEIKQQLTLASVLQHYGLKPDKNGRLHCPFHDDKTPSLQVYPQTHTVYCFSSNCKTHGKSLDVIDFIMYKENMNKHQALKRASTLIKSEESVKACSTENKPGQENEPERILFLTKLFSSFKISLERSKPALDYIRIRNLDYKQIEIGYNGGSFHHGEKKEETLITQCLKYGLLLDKNLIGHKGEKIYSVFGKNCIVFPLKNKDNQIVSLYFRSTINDKDQRHFYLKNRQGLYPAYPDKTTKTLILTESVIDTATLMQTVIATKNEEAISTLACYGTNGLMEEHLQAIKSLPELFEIIFAFDMDEAGKESTSKYARQLHEFNSQLRISTLELPCKDVNETLQAHEPEIFAHLLENRKEIPFLFSTEKQSIEIKKEEPNQQINELSNTPLNATDPYNLYYSGEAADYYVKGGIRCSLDCLKVSLQIIDRASRMDIRTKADLYEHRQVNTIIKTACEQLNIDKELLHKDLSHLTQELETYRSETLKARSQQSQKKMVTVPANIMNQCLDFLKSDNLLQNLNELLGKSGIVGEDTNRLFLFLIACSYKMPDTLHALIQGSSGSGKTRLLKIICEVMPIEDVIKFTRVTDNSFYNYREDYLVNKLLGFEDIDGLKEEAMYAVRELISNEILVSSTTTKTEEGKLVAIERTVRGPVASISCTTRGEIYEDNMSRVFLIAVDESPAQTKRIIHYQQQTACGQIEHRQEKETRQFIQNCVRLLQSCEVINPYAGQIHLPEQAHKIRRLNDLYLSFVKQITLLHQYQREKDAQGRLISIKEDLRIANDIMFDSIILKIDELDGGLRQFFERLKKHVQSSGGKDQWFILRDIRQGLHLSKTQLHRYINELLELEYLQQKGYANRGFQYQITYWDNIEALRSQIKQQLDNQIKEIK